MKLPSTFFSRLLCAGFFMVLLGAAQARSQDKELKSGWFRWDPYQFETSSKEVPYLNGLDIELVRSILETEGYRVRFDQMDWESHLDGLKTGSRDLAAGAFYNSQRDEYAFFSDPYRSETDVLILPKGNSGNLKATSLKELFAKLGAGKFRLGIIRGYSYGAAMDDFLRDPAHANGLIFSETDNENLAKLMDGSIDGFLADRLVASTIAWRAGLRNRIEEHPLVINKADIHVMFSKASCSPDIVESFNRGLREIKENGGYKRITRHYVVPVLLGMTVNRMWFTAIGLVGTFAFAISGILLARKENYSIFGALVLAGLPALGGGILRDILTDRHPLGMLREPVYPCAVLATVLLGALFYKMYDYGMQRYVLFTRLFSGNRFVLPFNVVEFFDALGLGAFTVTGVVIAVEQQCEPLWLWGPFLAVLTGAGGGILRDIVRADANNPALKGMVYAEIALLWGLALSLFLDWQTIRLNLTETTWAVWICMAGALVTRLLAVKFGTRSPVMGRRF